MKQMKVLSVFGMLAMTLGLAACGGGTKECANNKHSWGKWEEVTPATCTVDGTQKRVCEKCKKEETKAIKAGHKWGDWQDVKVATCQEKGSQKRVCSACNAEETRETDLADHTWGDWETVTEADCTNPGSRKHKCSVCESEETETVDALGHDWGEWEEITAPTCTEKGSHKHKCARCEIEETEDVPALGHDIQLIGDDTEPEQGKAKVRVYTCANNCGTTYLGFKANEVSEESKEHLTFTETQTADGKTEIGASFWGRPIGNALALKADGSSQNEQNNECVYCSTETGDFFEYVFDLTQDQVDKAGLDNCRLYCDAKPANWLNGKDFFAYDASSDDWTPGYYIDGADEHVEKDAETGQPVMVNDHAQSVRADDGSEAAGEQLETQVKMGKRIEDYRYILYVDNQVKAFDDSITNPTHGNGQNMTREEFVLPYTFSLHAGENRISLRMAGGYRSTFYNFTFRPVEEVVPPEPVDEWVEDTTTVMPTPAADGALVKRYVKEGKDDVKYEIAVATSNITSADSGAWKTDPSTGEFKLNNGKTATFKFDLPKAFEGKMYQTCYMDSYNSNKSKLMFYQTNNHCNIEVKVNNNAIDFSQFATTTFQQVFGDETDGSNSLTKDVELGDVALLENNVISYKRVETLNTIVKGFVFIGKDHDHSYVAGEKAADSALRSLSCTCGQGGYELQAADLTSGQKAPNPSDKNTRLGKGEFDDVWNVTGIEAGEYDLYLQARASAGNANKGYWNSAAAVAAGDTESNNGGSELSKDYKYKVKVGDGEYVNLGDATSTYAGFGLTENTNEWTNKPLARITVPAGATSITIHNMNNGYSIWVFAARLIRA